MATVTEFLKRRPDLFQDMTPRQMEVLEKAAERGYLIDYNPLVSELRPTNFHRVEGLTRPILDDDVACWPSPWEIDPVRWERRYDRESLPVEDAISVGPPRHHTVWEHYCCEVLQRPAMTLGHFTPRQLSLFCGQGIRVHNTDQAAVGFSFPPSAWAQLIKHVVSARFAADYIRWDGHTLACEFWSGDDLEKLAKTLHRSITEHLEPPAIQED